MKTNTPKIFLSYSWKDKDESLILERDFQRIGIPLIKDTLNLKFKDSLDDFMRSIRNSDFVIILLSDNYLKSQNCMFEALEIFKEQNYIKKILPIFIKSPKIFNAQDRLKYIKYWKEQKEQLKAELEEVDVTSAIESYKDLKQIEVVYSSMDTVLKSICDLKSSTLESLKKENYKSIIEYLGFEDISFLIDLFKISQIDNYSIMEFAIEKHIEKYGESALALFSKASCKSNLGKKEEAKVLYEKSLKLDSQNSFTWNNLGFLLDKQFNQINKALECYNKAIDLEPNLIVARINRATVYSRKNKNKKAKEEYLKILEISPSEPKAHNNLANIYRQYKDKDKVLYHCVEAIKYNPTYAEAYLNLANYYDVELFDYENALQYYNVAKRLCKNESFELIIDKLIEMLNKRKQDK